jgi:hypothetical protein
MLGMYLDTSIELFQAVYSFLLTIGDFGFVASNDYNLFMLPHGSHKKHHSQFINNPIFLIYNVT